MPAYKLPKLTMTTDIVIFMIRDDRLEILLIRRGERLPLWLTLVPARTHGGTGTNRPARVAGAVEAPGRGLPPWRRWRAAARPGRGDRPRAGV